MAQDLPVTAVQRPVQRQVEKEGLPMLKNFLKFSVFVLSANSAYSLDVGRYEGTTLYPKAQCHLNVERVIVFRDNLDNLIVAFVKSSFSGNKLLKLSNPVKLGDDLNLVVDNRVLDQSFVSEISKSQQLSIVMDGRKPVAMRLKDKICHFNH
jgi:hypothetical protein